MKRLLICLLLLVFVFFSSAAGTFAVRKNAQTLLALLEETAALMQENDEQSAFQAARACEDAWKKSNGAFFLLLDHDTFDDLKVLLPMLSTFIELDTDNAQQQILRCVGVLHDLLQHQRLTLGNIL